MTIKFTLIVSYFVTSIGSRYYVSGKKHAWKMKPSMGKSQKMLEEYGNIIQHIQIWILGDLSFSRYVVSLYVAMIIFRKKIITESEL